MTHVRPPIRPAPSVEKQSKIVLNFWKIALLPDGDAHFVGFIAMNLQGRVSSRIVEFDANKMIGVTRSGRRYVLIGKPGNHPDADFLLSIWCKANKIDPDQVSSIGPDDLAARLGR